MSNLTAKALILAFSTLAIATQACTLASPTTVKMEPDNSADSKDDETDGTKKSNSTSSTSSASSTNQCTAKFVKPDLSKLTSCGDKAHCYEKAKMDPQMAGALIACKDASQVCVPDEVLNADGGKLKSCKVAVLNGAAGGCIQLDLLPQAKEQGGSALKQDVCDAGQVCIPCTDPTNGNAPTPFCQPIGVRDAACSGGSPSTTTTGTTTAPAQQGCCTTKGVSNGVCIASSAIPADSRDQTIQDTCTGDNKCVPKAMVEGKPVTCDGGFLGKGVCMDKCFNEMLGIAGDIGFIQQDKCGDTELCIPCDLASMQGGSTPIPGCQ